MSRQGQRSLLRKRFMYVRFRGFGNWKAATDGGRHLPGQADKALQATERKGTS